MSYYLVSGRFRAERLEELHTRLRGGEFLPMRPFGYSLNRGLEGARLAADGEHALWEEEDYCSPPLAMERKAVLDDYFEDLRWEAVPEGQGWRQIGSLPSLWPPQGPRTRP